MSQQRPKATVDIHVCLISEASILMMKRANTGYQDGNYSLPAGHLEFGETATQAAIREAKEEIGINLAPNELKLLLTMHHMSDSLRIALFFQAIKWEREPQNMEPNKCENLCWFEFDELPSNIVPYINKALVTLANGDNYAEFGWN